MSELFKKVLVACAAISAFGGGAYLGDNLIGSYIRSKAVAIQNLNASEQAAVSDQPADISLPKPKATFSFSLGK